MNTTTLSPLVESCKSFLRAFLIAVAFGLLAGATLSSVGHATAAPVAAVDNAAGWQGQSITCAGRIRQQAQRIAKLYLQIGMGLEVGHARQQMSRAEQQIDDDIAELKQHPLDAKAGEALARVTQSPYKATFRHRFRRTARVASSIGLIPSAATPASLPPLSNAAATRLRPACSTFHCARICWFSAWRASI